MQSKYHSLIIFILFVFVNSSNLILIVGDVTTSSSRILFELQPHYPKNKLKINLELFKMENEKKIFVSRNGIIIEKIPKIYKFTNLEENVKYIAEFGSPNENVTFTTYSQKRKSFKIVVLSCNRFYEDRDIQMWKQLLKKDNDFDLMLHVGDQIYADSIYREYETRKNYTFLEILNKYRNIYRTTFGNEVMQFIFRKGHHLMLPDDHE